MFTPTIRRLETLLVTANALLTAPHPEAETLDAYHGERERIFVRLWSEQPRSGTERSVVESIRETYRDF